MQTEMLKKTIKTGGKALELGVEAEHVKRAVAQSLEDVRREAKRALKRGRYAAEEVLDETAYRVKQHPWQAVGLTLGLGFGVGALIGVWVGRGIGRCGKEE